MADQKPTGRPTGPSGKRPGPSRTNLLYVLILVACAGYLFWSMGGAGTPQASQGDGGQAGQTQAAAPKSGGRLSTSEFVTAVDDGRVKSATWSSSSGTVTGTYWEDKDRKSVV